MVKKVVKCLCLILHYHVQESLFGEIVFDDDFHEIITTPGRMNDDDDFDNAKIYMMYNILNMYKIC